VALRVDGISSPGCAEMEVLNVRKWQRKALGRALSASRVATNDALWTRNPTSSFPIYRLSYSMNQWASGRLLPLPSGALRIADPALAARLVKRTAVQLLGGDMPDTVIARDGGSLVGLFESLAALRVRRGSWLWRPR
jgi:hypothetical protein